MARAVEMRQAAEYWAGAQITIALSGFITTTLFVGRIDRVTITASAVDSARPWLLSLSATEALTWSDRLNAQVIRPPTGYSDRLTAARRAIPGLVVTDGNNVELKPIDGTHVTARRLAESLVARPGAWPVWSPDSTHVAPSTYKLGAHPSWNIRAAEVVDPSPAIEIDGARQPHTIIYTEGGIYGPAKSSSGQGHPRPTLDAYDRGLVAEVDCEYCPTSGTTMSRAASHVALIQAQKSSPRTIRVDGRRYSAAWSIQDAWDTWESPTRLLRVTGDKTAGLLAGKASATQDYKPIGGQLTIRANYLVHDFTCIWMADALVARVWRDAASTWSKTTTTWSEQ